MALDQQITIDATGALAGANALNATIASIGTQLGKLNEDLAKTQRAFGSLESKLTTTLRTARDAALSLGKAANETTASVQKAVSGLASIDSALEARVAKVRALRSELQQLAGTSLAGGGGRGGRRGGLGGSGGGGAGGGGISPDGGGEGVARLGDLSRFSEQLTRQFLIIGQSRAFFFLKDQIGDAANNAKELAARITEIRTITQDADRSTGQWAASLIKVSNELGRPVTQVADAAYQALSNNVRGAKGETESFITAIGKFANVTRTSLPGAVDSISSVLNSYGLSANQATDVSAKLFKAIELGRFRGEELAAALGKTAPIASQLGVSLDELLGTFIVLTDQGQSLNTASTLTLNLFNSLLKPSQNLTQLYANAGVSGGQQFIQVNNGLAGVLELLGNRAKGSTEEITKFFTNLRSTRGVIGITEDLRRFQNSLTDTQNARQSFDVAVNIDNESTNRSIDRFRENLKNSAIQGIGDTLVALEGALARFERATGLLGGITELVPTVAFGLLLQQTTGFAIQLRAGTTALAALERLTPSVAQAMLDIKNNTLLFVGAFTAAYLVGQKLFAQSQSEILLIDTANQKLKERSAIARQLQDSLRKDNFKEVETSISNIQKRLASVRTEITKDFEKSKESVRTAFETVAGSLQSTLERSQQTISDINRDISRNLNEIDNSRKGLGDFSANAEKGFLNFKIDLATPRQQIRLLDDEITRLTQKGQALIREGASLPGTQGDELIREGRANLQEALGLAKQRVSATQADARARGVVLSSTHLLNQLENDSLRVVEARRAAEQDLRRIKAEEVAQLKLQKQAEQERISRLQITIKAFSELQTKIGSGSITGDKDFFREGAFKPELVKAEIERLSSQIQTELFKIDPGAAARFSIDVANSVRASQEAINNTIRQTKAAEDAQALIQARAAAEKEQKAIAEINTSLAGGNQSANQQGLAKASQLFDAILATKNQDNPLLFDTTSSFLGDNVLPTPDKNTQQLRDIKAIIDEVRNVRANEEGIVVLTPEQIERLRIAEAIVTQLRSSNTGTTSLNLEVIGDNIRRAAQSATDLNAALANSVQTRNAIVELEVSTRSEFSGALEILTSVTNVGATQIGEALDRLENRINSAFQNSGDSPQGFSHGGTVMGQGMDSILAAVRPGEIVLNPQASKSFASQLMASNHMSSIPYGQHQTVNVGDVNVYVSGSSTSNETVREIGRGLRRELRRGNLG